MLTRPYLCPGSIWFDLILGGLDCCEELLTGCECGFSQGDIRLHLTFPLLKSLLHRTGMSPIGSLAVYIPNALSNLNTSFCNPQNTHLGSLKAPVSKCLCSFMWSQENCQGFFVFVFVWWWWWCVCVRTRVRVFSIRHLENRMG